MVLAVPSVPGETILRYKVNGSAEMTALVQAHGGDSRCGASRPESLVRELPATVVSTVMCIPFMRSSRNRRLPWRCRSLTILEQMMAMRKRDDDLEFPTAAGNRVRQALKMEAMSLSHRDSALGAFYRRLRSRMDKPCANTATAHKLARMVYFMLTPGGAYGDQGQRHNEEQQRRPQATHRRARLHSPANTGADMKTHFNPSCFSRAIFHERAGEGGRLRLVVAPAVRGFGAGALFPDGLPGNADIYSHLGVTLLETALAFGIGTAFGLACGLWLGPVIN